MGVTTYHLRTADGVETFTGTITPAPGGGSSSVQAVDLGVVDIPTLYTAGPQTLLTMTGGQYLKEIKFADVDFVAWDSLPQANANALIPGFGTIKTFGWYTFASLSLSGSTPSFNDTVGQIVAGLAYNPNQALETGAGQAGQSMVLASQLGGAIQAAVSIGSGTGNGVRVAALAAWQANHNYQAQASNTAATPGVLYECGVVANGTMWYNSGTTGTSGGSSPDFAGNAGGSVADGANIVWTDTSAAVPTVGSIRVVAEIWTPA